MRGSTFKTKKEEFLKHLKSRAVKVDGEYLLSNVFTINAKPKQGRRIFDDLKKEGRIIVLGRKSEIDHELINKIKKELKKDPKKSLDLVWQRFFINPSRVKEGLGIKYFKNTSVLYKIK